MKIFNEYRVIMCRNLRTKIENGEWKWKENRLNDFIRPLKRKKNEVKNSKIYIIYLPTIKRITSKLWLMSYWKYELENEMLDKITE